MRVSSNELFSTFKILPADFSGGTFILARLDCI